MLLKCRKMTPKGHEMFSNYVKKLRSLGKWSFTIEEAMKDLNASANQIQTAVYRMKKSGDLISPSKGFYVIVPPESKPLGSIPAEELVPILMSHLGITYYVGLLTAAMYYGATHQKPNSFQIVSNKRIKHSLKFGKVNIIAVYKKSLANLPVQDIIVATGYLKISSPELTIMDLFLYPNRSGGINHIATVLEEMIETVDSKKLLLLADLSNKYAYKYAWLQRLGYILEKIDPIDSEIKHKIIDELEAYLSSKKLKFIALASELPTAGYQRSKKWMIIENSTVEGD